MKKVALVTCFLDNFGACLQALALQRQIEELNCVCDIIAYIGPSGYRQEILPKVFKNKLLCIARDVINFLQGRKAYNGRKTQLSFYKFRKKYLRFSKEKGGIKYYHSIEQMKGLADRYDAFVCGSDQIWNPTFYKRNDPVYHLRFAAEKPRIAYAPSIGLPEIPAEYEQEFISFVNDFDSVSVREQRGSEIIERLCKCKAKVVLDPTLLAGREFWLSLLDNKYTLPYEEYIFAYIFSNTENVSRALKDIQDKTNLPIVYVNISNLSYQGLTAFCKSYADPIDFLQLIKNAKFVLTDSFHGTAFSLLLQKDFYVFKRERKDESIDMYSRIESILSMTGLQERVFSLKESFAPKTSIDYTDVDQKLEEKRNESRAYLKNSLFGEDR